MRQKFATRRLIYADSDGNEKEVVLTVFVPFEVEHGGWKCEFTFEPSIYRAQPRGGGVDCIHALVMGLRLARVFLESTNLWGRASWQGMLDCGLPSSTDEPVDTTALTPIMASEDVHRLAVLATRKLGYPDDAGIERETILTLYLPFQESDIWRCEFAFDPWPEVRVGHGVGSDAIEATLDALASARVLFDAAIPIGWTGSDDLLDCADFPIKSGRAFHIRRSERGSS
ncbi:MAG: hypothetical protein IPM54_25970 [Polyangiaceae bacterium]|nr:hypothetical protein [Polyangiaceae bacterium]